MDNKPSMARRLSWSLIGYHRSAGFWSLIVIVLIAVVPVGRFTPPFTGEPFATFVSSGFPSVA
jgi:hypothetical protein